jgi:hypothetical protein
VSIASIGLSEFELKPKRSGPGPQTFDPELDRMISEEEAARLLNISRDTLRRRAAAGVGARRYHVGARRIAYRLREVLAAPEAT